MQKNKGGRNNEVTVRGLVTPIGWDEDGQATHVSIATFDEDEYFVGDKKVRLRLLNQLGKEVTVTGILEEEDEKKYLKACSVLQPEKRSTKKIR